MASVKYVFVIQIGAGENKGFISNAYHQVGIDIFSL